MVDSVPYRFALTHKALRLMRSIRILYQIRSRDRQNLFNLLQSRDFVSGVAAQERAKQNIVVQITSTASFDRSLHIIQAYDHPIRNFLRTRHTITGVYTVLEVICLPFRFVYRV